MKIATTVEKQVAVLASCTTFGICASGTPVAANRSKSFTARRPYGTMSSPVLIVSVYQSRRAWDRSNSRLPSHLDLTTDLITSSSLSGSSSSTTMNSAFTVKIAFSGG